MTRSESFFPSFGGTPGPSFPEEGLVFLRQKVPECITGGLDTTIWWSRTVAARQVETVRRAQPGPGSSLEASRESRETVRHAECPGSISSPPRPGACHPAWLPGQGLFCTRSSTPHTPGQWLSPIHSLTLADPDPVALGREFRADENPAQPRPLSCPRPASGHQAVTQNPGLSNSPRPIHVYPRTLEGDLVWN